MSTRAGFGIVSRFGVLRLCLAALILLVIVAAPFAGDEVHYDDWRVLPSLIAPVLALILVFVLPMDILMTIVFMSAKSAPERSRLGWILWAEIVLLAALVLAWTSFFLALL